jgi:hypothetical protein
MTLWRKRQIQKLKQLKESEMKNMPMIIFAVFVLLLVYAIAGYLDEQSELADLNKCFVTAGDHPPQRIEIPCRELK